MPKDNGVQNMRRQVGAFLVGFGLLLMILGARPEWFDLSRTPAIGFLQILTFLIGLGFLTFGLYLRLLAAWQANGELPFRADLGMRLAATGYILAAVAALADVLGFGSHADPMKTYFGPWQYTGLVLGLALVALGYGAAWPWTFPGKPGEKDGRHE